MQRIIAITMAMMFSGAIQGMAGPAPESLRGTIRTYIAEQEKMQGAFGIVDNRTDTLRRLELVRVHERVGKTGDYYYSCTDMRDVLTGDELDLDFDIIDRDGALSVVSIRIHKDNGSPRYTYDENDNMIPVS
ncbi:MAG: hypothetical protein Q8R76_01390 [Candidatus Omnitrophota bacterium]|nr:hypothetical protein [Candidatus Omnitrophota bacterium]